MTPDEKAREMLAHEVIQTFSTCEEGQNCHLGCPDDCPNAGKCKCLDKIRQALQSAHREGYNQGVEEAAAVADRSKNQQLQSADLAKASARANVASHREAGAETASDIATAIRKLKKEG